MPSPSVIRYQRRYDLLRAALGETPQRALELADYLVEQENARGKRTTVVKSVRGIMARLVKEGLAVEVELKVRQQVPQGFRPREVPTLAWRASEAPT